MRILFVSFFIVILDQVTKFLIKGISIPSIGVYIEGIPFRTSINVISDVLQITYIENPGMAFGLQFGGKLFLSIFTIFATFLILFFIYKNRSEPFYIRFALALILGGAIGNLIDRTFYGVIYGYAPLFYGNVVDFIHVNTPDFNLFGKHFTSWPIFNVADMAVSTGFLLILFGYNKIFKHKDEELQPGAAGFTGNELSGEFGNVIIQQDGTEIITENRDYSGQNYSGNDKTGSGVKPGDVKKPGDTKPGLENDSATGGKDLPDDEQSEAGTGISEKDRVNTDGSGRDEENKD